MNKAQSDKLEELDHTINGNGHPGIKTKLALLAWQMHVMTGGILILIYKVFNISLQP